MKLREREQDALTSFLMGEGVDSEKAKEEAARILRASHGGT